MLFSVSRLVVVVVGEGLRLSAVVRLQSSGVAESGQRTSCILLMCSEAGGAAAEVSVCCCVFCCPPSFVVYYITTEVKRGGCGCHIASMVSRAGLFMRCVTGECCDIYEVPHAQHVLQAHWFVAEVVADAKETCNFAKGLLLQSAVLLTLCCGTCCHTVKTSVCSRG